MTVVMVYVARLLISILMIGQIAWLSLDRTALIPGWHYAMIHQIMPSDDVIIRFADRSSGTILAAELEWIMNQQQETESPIQTVSDILSPGDVIIVEPIGQNSDQLFTLRQWPEIQGRRYCS